MNCIKNFIINGIKCCTDKILQAANCVIGIPSIGAIVAKSYNARGLKDVSWEILIIPLSGLFLLNILYYCLCKKLLSNWSAEENQGSVV